jgi:hypothetical protein
MRASSTLAVALLSWVALFACAGCDDDSSSARRRAPLPQAGGNTNGTASGTTEAARAVDASPLGSVAVGALDPAPLGGDLAADIAAFTTVDACVSSHVIGDAVLGDALLALGYDTFARDACRVLLAAKQKRLEPCREITVSTLRRHCETLVATLVGEAELCPDDFGGRGRDATCIALARRDGRLCAAELEPRKTRCEAMLAGNAKRCAGDRQSRTICVRDVERWRAVLGHVTERPPLAAPSATFKLELADGGVAQRQALGDVDLSQSFGRGAVVLEDKTTAARRLDFGSIAESSPLVGHPFPAIRMSVELPAIPDGGARTPPKGGRIRSVEATVPGGPQVQSPPAKNDLVLEWQKLELDRGGAVEFTINGVAGEGERSLKVHVEVKTFVRDFAFTRR